MKFLVQLDSVRERIEYIADPMKVLANVWPIPWSSCNWVSCSQQIARIPIVRILFKEGSDDRHNGDS